MKMDIYGVNSFITNGMLDGGRSVEGLDWRASVARGGGADCAVGE